MRMDYNTANTFKAHMGFILCMVKYWEVTSLQAKGTKSTLFHERSGLSTLVFQRWVGQVRNGIYKVNLTATTFGPDVSAVWPSAYGI